MSCIDLFKRNPRTTRAYKGFTLIEVVITIGLLAITVAFAVPVSSSLLGENRVANTAGDLTANIFRYQQYSYSKRNGDRYGILLDEINNQYILFTVDGATTPVNYSTRETTLDEVFVIDGGVEINLGSSDGEFVFAEGSFRPDDPQQITLENSSTSVTLDINQEGLIDYYF